MEFIDTDYGHAACLAGRGRSVGTDDPTVKSIGEETRVPFGNSHRECIQKLGRALKHLRAPGEQFCVFAFDLTEHGRLTPDPATISKDALPLDPQTYPDANWTAAFWSVTTPYHTEVAILDNTYWQWVSNYTGLYDPPQNLQVYSALIPCFRDGTNGMCSHRIQGMMLEMRRRGLATSLRVGWSNDDVDVEASHATKHGMADLEDDEIGVSIFPPSLGMSIAGHRVDAFGNDIAG